MAEKWLEMATDKVRQFKESDRDQSVSNRLDHLERTRRRALSMARKISKERNAQVDYLVLQMAALLHDVDEPYSHDSSAIDRSAQKAKEILDGIGFPKDRTERVIKLIMEHSSERQTPSTSLESGILYDADKLDGLGEIGIARVFALCGQRGMTPVEAVAWYERKIGMALPGMRTELGMRLAEKRLKEVNRFLERLRREQKRSI